MPEEERVDMSAQPLPKETDPSRPGAAMGSNDKPGGAVGQFAALLAVAVAGIVGVQLLLYFHSGAWQTLIAAGGAALSFVLMVVARGLVRRGKPTAAAYCTLLGVLIVYAGGELSLSGATWYFLAGGLLLIVLFGIIAWPRRWDQWLIAAGLHVSIILLINGFKPLPRYNAMRLALLNVQLMGITALLALVALWQLVRTLRGIGTIRTRLLVSFVTIVSLLTLVLGMSVTLGSLQGARQQATRQLISVSILKEAEINTWLQDLQSDLVLALVGDEVTRRAIVLLEGSTDPSTVQLASSVIRTRFEQVLDQTGRFQDLFLLNIEGQVVLSSYPEEEGDDRSYRLYFRNGRAGFYLQPPAYSATRRQVLIYASRPVLGAKQQVLGVLVGRANLSALNGIMAERTGLGETGETYLVASNALLTSNRFGEQEFFVSSPGIRQALQQHTAGSGLYENYRHIPVVGAYRWLPALQAALLAEQEQAEAFRPVYSVLGIVGLVGLIGVLLAIGISLLVTRSIATPLAELADTAARIAAGSLDQVARIERTDEIGTLAQAFNAMTARLRSLIDSLEKRVADRTRELKQRSAYLESAAQVTRAVSSILETGSLLQKVVELIQERFDLYYVGLFLVDASGEWAVLRANAGETGRPLPALGQRLQVGRGSMVGWSIEHQEAWVTRDAKKDTVRLEQPELPDTRSEAVLPLRFRGQVLGALTVQHTQVGAFDQDLVVVLQTLADQVAVALDNARLFAEREEALKSTERAYGELSRRAWAEILHAQPDLGFRSDERGIFPAGSLWRPEMEQAWRTGQTTLSNGADSDGRRTLAVPIKIRDQVVGVLDTYKPAEAGDWTQDEIALLESIAKQLDSALESARLYQDTQRRAAREQAIRQVTERMRRAVEVEAILQSTVTELAKALGAPRAYVRLGIDAGQITADGQNDNPTGDD